jgi:hypothetical protein
MSSDFWPIVGVTALLLVVLMASGSVGIGIVLAGPLMGGLYWFLLKSIRGQKAEVGDAFAGFTLSFLQLFLAGLIVSILTAIGLMLCILPGIYLGVAWQFTYPLVIDKRFEFWDAMEVSRRVISHHWWSFFALVLLIALINLGGVLLCVVGLFITVPWTLLALVYAYEDIFAKNPWPGTPVARI